MGNTVEYSYKIWLLPGSCNLFSRFVLIGYYSKRNIKSSEDFVLSGRKLSFSLLVTGIVATWYCAGPLFGGAANAYLFGLHGVIFDPFSGSLCLILAGLFFQDL
jgi:Na+/proline symporter